MSIAPEPVALAKQSAFDNAMNRSYVIVSGLAALCAGSALSIPTACVARTAQLLDFVPATGTVSGAAQSGGERRAPMIAEMLVDAPPSVALPAPVWDVPARLRQAFVAHGAERLLTFGGGGASGCAGAPYRPAGFLTASVEARRRQLYPLVAQSACRNRLPVALLDAVIIQESRYDSRARSSAGAYGLLQLMPSTARELGVARLAMWDNLEGGARYLKQQLDRFGSPQLALAAYNAGPTRVAKRRAIPNIAETKTYVARISRYWSALSKSSAPMVTVNTLIGAPRNDTGPPALAAPLAAPLAVNPESAFRTVSVARF